MILRQKIASERAIMTTMTKNLTVKKQQRMILQTLNLQI
jgi:hypothetical protein